METSELGTCLGRHPGGLTANGVLGGGLCVALGIFFVAATFYGLNPMAALVGIGLLAGGVWMIRGALAWVNVRVEIYERGLVYLVRNEAQVVPWSSIRSVAVRWVRDAGALGFGEIRQKATRFTLHTTNGRALELTPALYDFAELAEHLRTHVDPSLPSA